jgi:hypothetical protein
MKLSKAQQAVVGKMREGWELHTTTALTKEGTVQFISRATYNALWNKYVIELKPGSLSICRLTEQYKTQPNSVTGKK